MIRLISTLLIVSCHFLQFYGNKLAFIFNIGVQFFLIISGLLYGLKSDEITIEKTWKNIKKILLDYLIFIVIAIVLHFLFLDTKYTLRQLLPVFFLHAIITWFRTFMVYTYHFTMLYNCSFSFFV